ncbi:TonB-dependent receptor [Roseateles violae]|uniref:TonB-dependent receptor n=1 Tax=Roseateles violae TaxID=3058042 RepID=A0ABT8DVG4_9BURK|nr:TonB-dependent receptor [Pelomonas sp. PFR6]MDN3922071.1 TonB-dependent receptor [Pelomonas sp. PFR6]
MKNKKPNALALAAALNCVLLSAAQAQSEADRNAAVTTLPVVTINASADASAQGLSPSYAGGQVARGGRAGILGSKDNLDTPFSITAYTNELIQDRLAKSVGEVLQNDASVRVARGFGNFQEAYFVRGFILSSDDIAYNGLYSLLPRQYIATELFERVEVLRGASAFLMGASPNGGGIGGNINLLPKRAPNEALTRLTVGGGDGGQGNVAMDVARRFGSDKATGLRVNAAYRDGGTAIADEKNKLGLFAVGMDWRSRDVRLSGDIGYQDNKLERSRTSVTLGFGLTALPALPEADSNFAQPWTYSNERDVFGTLRGEWDVAQDLTAWAAWGMRRNDEANSLANLTVTNAANGDGNTSRFDNTRQEQIGTGEIGLRGKLRTGSIGHEWVASAAYFKAKNHAAYIWDYFNTQATNLYAPTYSPLPAFTAGAFKGNNLADPGLTAVTELSSFALGDTLSLLDGSLLVTLGARYQKLSVDEYAYDTQALTPYDMDRTSPVFGAVYKFSRQLSAYANYIEGLSRGSTIAAAGGQPERMLPPYVSKQKELGLKYDAGRIGFGAAAFSTDKPRALAIGQAAPQGEDEHRGLELNVYGEASRGLKLLGGITWLDTTQRDTGSAATEGKRTLGVPKTQANLGVEWEVAAISGLALDGRLSYTGGVYADSANTIAVPDWTRFDIGARYLFELKGTLLTARARIDNVANKKYWASSGGYPDQGYLVIGAPRTVNLSLSADF